MCLAELAMTNGVLGKSIRDCRGYWIVESSGIVFLAGTSHVLGMGQGIYMILGVLVCGCGLLMGRAGVIVGPDLGERVLRWWNVITVYMQYWSTRPNIVIG